MNGGLQQYARLLVHVKNPIILRSRVPARCNRSTASASVAGSGDGHSPEQRRLRYDRSPVRPATFLPSNAAASVAYIERTTPLYLRPADIDAGDSDHQRRAYKCAIIRQACTVMALGVAISTIIAMTACIAAT